MQLLRFHLIEDESCEKEIKKELEKKLDKMVMRDLFGKIKKLHRQRKNGNGQEKNIWTDVELTKAEEKNSDLACRMGRKYCRSSAVSHRKSSPDTGK